MVAKTLRTKINKENTINDEEDDIRVSTRSNNQVQIKNILSLKTKTQIHPESNTKIGIVAPVSIPSMQIV